MTRKDYERLALAFQEARRLGADAGSCAIASECIATALQGDNDRFDRERFLLACEPGRNVKARS